MDKKPIIEKPIIDYEDYINELIKQEDEYIMTRLYFKCHFCEQMIPIREGIINETTPKFAMDAENEETLTMHVKKNIVLSCKKCSERIFWRSY